MRKFYSLLTGLLFVLSSLHTNAQPNPVPDSCRADFEKIPNSANNPLTVSFRAQPWHNNNKKPEEICWHFGDGKDTCIQYDPLQGSNYVVTHTYDHPGNYNVCVRIRYQGGCVAEKCRVVEVGPVVTCRANFETGPISSTPLGRHFTAIPWHSENKKPVRICWQFGDGKDTCIQYSNTNPGPYSVDHIYTAPGEYEVCVKILYEGGCEARECKHVQVGEPDHCRADFERIPLSSVNDPLTVHFRALPWHDQNKKPARICWSFGDGKDTCIQYPENYTGPYTVAHHYNHPGQYEVCVKIFYYGGCEARKCKDIAVIIYNLCHVRLFEITPSATSLTRTLYFDSAPDNLQPVRVCWYFGDGTDTCVVIDSNTTQIPHSITHTYPGPGVYRACVKVLFANGCKADDCKEVEIRSATGLCGGYFTDSLINPHKFAFNGYSIHKPNDPVLWYRWTFGDGSTGVGQQVRHEYNVPGVYRVCLNIKTEKGCETRICNDVRVAGNNISILQLSPNPVVNILHALFFSTYNEQVTIKIMNANGVVIRTYTRNAVIGPNPWDFDVANLLPGVYSLTVQSPNQFASGIFLKQ